MKIDVTLMPPRSWDTFEDLCHVLFAAHWQDRNAQKNGRSGQAQAGVDVFGKTPEGKYWGVQCKLKSRLNKSELHKKEICDEIAKAALFQPALSHWIIATTANIDKKLQEFVHDLHQQQLAQKRFSIEIYDWTRITALLAQYPALAHRFYPQQCPPPLPKLIQLPAQLPAPCFVDPHESLATLHALLHAQPDASVPVVVHGMAGIGKTQLALQYSLKHLDDYFGIYWFDCTSATSLQQACQLFCKLQNLPLPAPQAAPATMRHWLETQQRWLLVFDHIQPNTLLQEYLPQAGAHHVLLTARAPNWPSMRRMNLSTWAADDALPWLQKRLPKESAQDILALNEVLGGLPMALEQACAYLHKHRSSVPELLQRMADETELTRLLMRQDVKHHTLPVLASLVLGRSELEPSARMLLELCACLAAEAIPGFLLIENAAALPAPLQNLDDFAWREIVMELENHGFCQSVSACWHNPYSNAEQHTLSLQMHRLIQIGVRTQFGFDAAVALLAAAFPDTTQQANYWLRCQILLPHAQKLCVLRDVFPKQAKDMASLQDKLEYCVRNASGAK